MSIFLVELTDFPLEWLKTVQTFCAASANESGMRFLNCLYVPTDSRCLFVVEALSHKAVRVTMDRAYLPNCRIVEVVEFDLQAAHQDDPTEPYPQWPPGSWFTA